MLNVEMTVYGIDDTLKEMRIDLEDALGRGVSKKRKNELIYKTLGAINTLWNLINVTKDVNGDSEDE